MSLTLLPIDAADLPAYKAMMQTAFQQSFEATFGPTSQPVLPEADIDQSLHTPGAVAYKALEAGEVVGGAVVEIDPATQHHHLHLLCVKPGCQNRGIGRRIWFALEALYPHCRTWETFTPYFDRRNINFYINLCHFKIVEYFHAGHPMPNTPENFLGDGQHGMFRFLKEMPAANDNSNTHHTISLVNARTN